VRGKGAALCAKISDTVEKVGAAHSDPKMNRQSDSDVGVANTE
jgi:hypothetical protein